MGTKHELAGDVAALVAVLRPGRPFLDLFCGMCSVGTAVAASGRPVWGNDIQHLAARTARCLMSESDGPPHAERLDALLRAAFVRNREFLEERFGADLEREAAILAAPTLEGYREAYLGWRHAGTDPDLRSEVRALAEAPRTPPYRLTTLSFAYGYFGLRQAIDIDSLRYAIDRAQARGALSAGEARWAVLGLLQTASVIGSSPGHFAQYLRGETENSLKRIVRQRRREAWTTLLNEVGTLEPVGDPDWRAGNEVFHRDALQIWPAIRERGFNDGIVYADPPYSTDHYSRYYHVLETLSRYDYPVPTQAGRYRPDRFVTPFSLKTQVLHAFDQLFRGVARLDSTLVLSYPDNGLLLRSGRGDITELLRRRFTSVSLVLRRQMRHSTLGARHGAAANSVEELVWVAR